MWEAIIGLVGTVGVEHLPIPPHKTNIFDIHCAICKEPKLAADVKYSKKEKDLVCKTGCN